MILDILFLPMLFFISVVVGYEDIRYGKVRNKWILIGIVWSLAVFFSAFFWYFIAFPLTRFFYANILHSAPDTQISVYTIHLGYIGRSLINAAIALVVAFLIWRFKFWAAGDAKLFIVYSLLIPLGYYWKSYFHYFPSFVLLINIFVPVFLYLLIRSFFYYIRFIYLRITESPDQRFWYRGKPQALTALKENNDSVKRIDRKKGEEPAKKESSWKRIKDRIVMILGLVSIFLIFGLFQEPIKQYTSIDISSLRMFIFAGLIIFSGLLSKIFQKPITFKIIIVVLVVILGYGFISSPAATWQTLYQSIKMMAIFMVIWSLFRKLIDFYISRTSIDKIKIEDLKPTMNLAEETLNKLKRDKEYYNKYFGVIYPEGLTEEQVEAVKKWAQEHRKERLKTISIYRPFPFVVWMFIGVIITLILKSSLLHIFFEI